MIIESISKIASPPLFYKLNQFIPYAETYIKLEGLNIAGSIKLTTARRLVESLEQAGKINLQTKLIESSSGNLGLALSILCKERGYSFICVSDPNILSENERLIQLYGATLIKVIKKDENGGYLASRIKFIQELIEKNSNYIWLNQYANLQNPLAHYSQTATEILEKFPNLDYLFVGVGTAGTLMGCATLFKEKSPNTKIIAIDSVGSVTFGFPPKKRYIPGLGTSRRPEIVNEEPIDEILLIEETDAIQMCRFLLKTYGLFLGGSSGSVLEGIRSYQSQIPPGSKVMTISSDFGYKYIDMIYDDPWIEKHFPSILTPIKKV